MTKRKCLTECVKMWTWLAKNSSANKSDYFDAHTELEVPFYGCYACGWVIQHYEDIGLGSCQRCPIKWPDSTCQNMDSPFIVWLGSRDPAVRTTAAKDIVKLSRQALRRLGRVE